MSTPAKAIVAVFLGIVGLAVAAVTLLWPVHHETAFGRLSCGSAWRAYHSPYEIRGDINYAMAQRGQTPDPYEVQQALAYCKSGAEQVALVGWSAAGVLLLASTAVGVAAAWRA